MPDHKLRQHDLLGREILSQICVGDGIDIGSADRPIVQEALTIDIDEDVNPDIVADMHEIPIEDNSQDYIIASHVLEHTDRVLDALKEWYRVLRPDANIGIMVPHGEFVNHVDLGDSDMTHKSLLTEKTLEIYLKHVGFYDVNVKRLYRPLANKKAPAVIAFGKKK